MNAPQRPPAKGRAPTVRRVDRLQPPAAAAIATMIERSAVHDRHSPIGEHKFVRLIEGELDTFGLIAGEPERPLGYAQATCFPAHGTLPSRLAAEVLVDPDHRGHGVGRALLERLLGEARGAGVERFDVWAHHADAAAVGLAEAMRLRPSRRLWQLALRLDAVSPRHRAPQLPADVRIRTFRSGADDAAMVALIRQAFADHPENAAFDLDDLGARAALPWFDPSAILLAEEVESGDALGVHWMKLDPERPLGEVYILAVAPEAQGRGIGRILLLAGLEEMRRRGVRLAYLYVDATNEAAISLYRDAGFRHEHLDTCYSVSLASRDRSVSGPAAGQQLVDQDHRGDHQQQVDEAADDVDEQPEQP